MTKTIVSLEKTIKIDVAAIILLCHLVVAASNGTSVVLITYGFYILGTWLSYHPFVAHTILILNLILRNL